MAKNPRKQLTTERRTIDAMIEIYCHGNHEAARELCQECAALGAYAQERIDNCPFGEDKPTCVQCPIHCYKPEAREQVRTVMRYAGPRMLVHHPLLAMRHKLRGQREVPEHPRRKRDGQVAAGKPQP